MENWFKKFFSDFERGNFATIEGHNNITIQDSIVNSTIDILEAIKESRSLSVFVFIIKEFSNLENMLNWKPFGKRTIANIIQTSSTKHNVKFRLFAVNCGASEGISEIELAYFKYLKNRSILIIDNCTDLTLDAKQFLSLYNDFQIGGCIFLNNSNECEPISKVLNHLIMYNDDEKPLHSLLDADVGKLEKTATKDTNLINSIGELAAGLGAEQAKIAISKTNNSLDSKFHEMSI